MKKGKGWRNSDLGFDVKPRRSPKPSEGLVADYHKLSSYLEGVALLLDKKPSQRGKKRKGWEV